MVPLLTQLLGLPSVDVESYEETGDELILSVEKHEESAYCPLSGSRLTHQSLSQDLAEGKSSSVQVS